MMLLDIMEVAMSHSGLNLAVAFMTVLHNFGIGKKVSFESIGFKDTHLGCRSLASPVTTQPITIRWSTNLRVLSVASMEPQTEHAALCT